MLIAVHGAARPPAAAATSASSSMSPCGGECRVGRTLLRGGPSSPARGADPRRRQHRPIATNKPSTSAAARRPPIATPSAAQAAGAGRAPRRSISHAHRCPRRCAAASRSSNISIIFPRKEFREKESATAASRRHQRVGRIAGRSADRWRWVGAPLACARGFGASLVNMLNQDRGALDRRKRLTPPQRRRPDQRLQEFVPILEQIDALRDALYDCTERLFDTVNKSPADLRSGYHRFLQLGGSTATDFRRYLRGQPLPRYGNGASRGYGRLRLIVKTSSGQSKC